MQPATVEGNLSTAMYHKYFPLGNGVWLLLLGCVDAKRRGGEPAPNPDRQWDAYLVHGEPCRPAGYDSPVFRQDRSPECQAREMRWQSELLNAVVSLGVRDTPKYNCWTVNEANVDALLLFLRTRAGCGQFAAQPNIRWVGPNDRTA